jgi:hypothetical protein
MAKITVKKKPAKVSKKKVVKKKDKASETIKRKQNQPKHHAGKSRTAVAMRRKKIIKALAEGKTNQIAGIEAGLSPKTAADQVSQILSEPKVKSDFKALLDKVIPDEILSAKYSELLSSKKVISAMIMAGDGMKDANSMTKDFIEVEDCATQLRVADSVSKLKGYLSDKHDLNLNLPITVEIVKFAAKDKNSE